MANKGFDYAALLVVLDQARTEAETEWKALDAAIQAIRPLISPQIELVATQPSNVKSMLEHVITKAQTAKPKRKKRSPKLTPEQEELIRIRSQEGKTQIEIGKEFGVSRATIWGVISGRRQVSGSRPAPIDSQEAGN